MNYIHRRYFISSSAFAIAGAAASSVLPWLGASRISASTWDEAPIDPAKADLIYRSKAPRNAEPRLEKLVENWITPTPQFYIRSHGANPLIMAEEFKVSVEGLVEKATCVFDSGTD